MTDVEIPLIDLRGQVHRYGEDVFGARREPHQKPLNATGRFVGGSDVERFEAEWAHRVGAEHCIGVGSGTAALTLILQVLARLHPDRTHVVVPGTSFVATVEAVYSAGLEPLFADVDDFGIMAPGSLRRVLELRPDDVLAVVPVHLYGQVAPLRQIVRTADRYNVPHVVDDACQAHGAVYDAQRVGGSLYTTATAWSFMPAKILGAWGDAGAVTTNDSTVARDIKRASNHGRSSHNTHRRPGTNARLDSLQARVLLAKLPDFDNAIRERLRKALYYNAVLDGFLHTQPQVPARVWSYYTAWTYDPESRDLLRDRLVEEGIETGVHYPYTLADAFEDRKYQRVRLPVSERLADTAITLPLYPEMTTVQQDRVVEAVRRFFQ